MIPQGSKEIQEGLYLYEYKQTLLGKEYLRRKLYSANGYCFYSTEEAIYSEEQTLDGDGNEVNRKMVELSQEEILPEQRTYMTQINLSIADSRLSIDQINKQYISVISNKNYKII